MPILNWKDEYSVKIKSIDEQHIELLETVNLLYDAMKKGQGKTVLTDVFTRLADYVDIHFKTEEKLMKKHDFPGLAEHVHEHESCRGKILELKKRYEGGNFTLSVELMNFLVDWLHHHLMDMDQRYSRFFIEKGIETS